jgi:hypothetical protein
MRGWLAAVVAAELAALIVVVGAPAASASGNVSWVAFRTQSRAIACAYVAPELRCDVLARGLRPEPKRPRCQLDWVGLSLRRSEFARPVCAGDTVNNGRSPILRYGMSWRRGDLTCLARRTGLRCRNGVGHGFTLSTRSWKIF